MNLKYYMDTVSFWNTASIPSEFARNLPFYIQQCAYFRAGKDYFTERSGVDSYLLMYTIAGEGVLQYREQEFYLKPGYAVLIDCRKYQFYSTGKSGKWELYWAHMTGEGVRKYYELAFADKFDVPFVGNRLKPVFEKLFRMEHEYSISHDLKLCSIANEFLSILIGKFLEEKKTEEHFSIQEGAEYLAQHYMEKISICELAEKMNFSLYHFIRVFKMETGETPYEFLTRCRINQSQILLVTTGLSVEEIAGQVGYHDVNTYIRAFKKWTGTTPNRFRKEGAREDAALVRPEIPG